MTTGSETTPDEDREAQYHDDYWLPAVDPDVDCHVYSHGHRMQDSNGKDTWTGADALEFAHRLERNGFEEITIEDLGTYDLSNQEDSE